MEFVKIYYKWRIRFFGCLFVMERKSYGSLISISKLLWVRIYVEKWEANFFIFLNFNISSIDASFSVP